MDEEIVDEIKWTSLAGQSLNSIINYLEKHGQIAKSKDLFPKQTIY